MTEPFKTLLETKDLWLPALTWLLGQLSATEAGIKVEEGIKKRLKWLKAPEAENAFQEAFGLGIQKYQKNRARNEAAQAVVSVLIHIANNDTSSMDRASILEQVFADRIDPEAISRVLNRHIFAIEGLIVSKEVVGKELERLLNGYLRPAFRQQRYFTEIVGFAEVIGLLRDIKENLVPSTDLEGLKKEYYQKTANKYELITMQGISPKVQNRTIGIRMQDVFIALEARQISGDIGNVFDLLDYLVDVVGRLNIGSDAIVFREKLAKVIHLRNRAAHSESSAVYELAGLQTRLLVNDLYMLFQTKIVDPYQLKLMARLETIRSHVFGSPLSISKEVKTLIESLHLVIQGHPGSGKSTIMKYLCWAISSQNSDLVDQEVLTYIPIPIRAIEFGESLQQGQVDSLDEFIMGQAGRFAPLYKFALSAGKAFIFIDGLDEVGLATLRLRVKERVDDFVADPAFSDNRMLITTRIVGYQPDGITGQFPHFELKELNDQQISKFIQNWYQAIHDEMPTSVNVETEQKQLLDAVLKNSSIHKMARNPLLLTIIALIKWQGRTLPEQRVLLYDAAAHTLIRSWPLAQRAVEFDEIFIREWLAPIAEKIFNNPTSDLIDEYSLTDELVNSMMQLKALPKLEAKSRTLELLDSISLHSGILLPRGTDNDGRNLYGFLHQTFAEYLTAYYLAGKWEDGRLEIKKYAHDPYWREVLLLMAGHLGIQRRAKAGPLLRTILDMNSSQYEDVIHRDLILGGRILGDAVPAPPEIVEEILMRLLDLWKTTKYDQLRKEVEEVFTSMKSTEYGPILVRLAKADGLDNQQTLRLAQAVGTADFSEELAMVISSGSTGLKIQAASMLAREKDTRGVEGLLRLLDSTDGFKSMSIYTEFLKLNDHKAMIRLVDKMIDKRDYSFATNQRVMSGGMREMTKRVVSSIFADGTIILSRPAKWALAILDPDNPKSEAYLLDCLTSEDDRLILEAAKILGEKQVTRGIDVLIDLMSKSKDEAVRFEAASSLAMLRNEAAIPFLKAIIDDENNVNRRAAAVLLFESYDDVYGRKALVDLLRSDKTDEGLWADRLIRKMPGFYITREYTELLLRNPRLQNQVNFAFMLASEGIEEGVEHLKRLLSVDDLEISLQAAKALLEIGKEDDRNHEIVKAMLLRLIRSDNLQAVLSAAQILMEYDKDEVYERLETLTQVDSSSVHYGLFKFLLNPASKSERAFNILKNNVSKMLLDFELHKPAADFSPGDPMCVAEIAFKFIHANITPTGELAFIERDDGQL